MSGPKTSKYTLTAQQRRLLIEQLERELKINEEKAKINQYIFEIHNICNDFDDPLNQANELHKITGEATSFINQMLKIKTDSDDILLGTNLLGSNLQELVVLRTKLERHVKSTKFTIAMLQKEKIEITKKLKQNLNQKIDSGFNLSFNNFQNDNAIVKSKNIILDELLLIGQEQNLSKILKMEIDATMQQLDLVENEEFLRNFKAVTVLPLLKKCTQYLNDYDKFSDAFYELFAKYKCLCENQNITPEIFEFSCEAIETLNNRISAIQVVAENDAEQTYISNAIDEVMEEMGYSVLGSRNVTKRNGTHFKNKLYSFDEGTAVNVTYASDGKVTMELGEIDNADRVPTDNESEQLCEVMETFCDDFKKIEKKLATKGVIVNNRISILPPNVEYAQIINTSDYEMKTNAEKFEVQKVKQKQQGQKAMRKEW